MMSNIVNLGLINVVTVVGLFLLAEHGSAQEAYQTWMRLLLTLAWHTLFGSLQLQALAIQLLFLELICSWAIIYIHIHVWDFINAFLSGYGNMM